MKSSLSLFGSLIVSGLAAVALVPEFTELPQEPEHSLNEFSCSGESSPSDKFTPPSVELTGRDEPMHWKSFDTMHAHFTETFVAQEGFGFLRMPIFDLPEHRILFVNGVPHVSDRIELIGLMDSQPVIYESGSMAMHRDDLKELTPRPLTNAEAQAMEQLLSGKSFAWLPATSLDHLSDQDGTAMANSLQASSMVIQPGATGMTGRIIAPLIATDECMDCHSASAGTVLGAFAYSMRPATPNVFPWLDPADEQTAPSELQ